MRTIRMAAPADAREVLGIYSPFVASTAVSFETEVPTEPEMQARMSGSLAFAPWLVAVEEGRVIGYAYASRHRERAAYGWSVDVSVYVDAGARRSGAGRALYASLFALLRLQGFHAAHAGITLPNEPSVRLHESLGFRKIGVYPRVGFKLGRWHDVGWWQLELRERIGPPAPVLSMDEASRAEGWRQALSAGLALPR